MSTTWTVEDSAELYRLSGWGKRLRLAVVGLAVGSFP